MKAGDTLPGQPRYPLLILLALLAGCVGYRPYLGPDLTVVAPGVADRVEQIREQRLTSLVSVLEVGPEELDRYVEERLARSYPGDSLEREARSLVRIGLYGEDSLDLRARTGDLLRRHLIGFHDPRRDRLGLVTRALARTHIELGLARELVLAHELTHALQDHRRDLYDLLAETAAAGSDRHLATLAVLEGEAQAVMYGYILAGSHKRLEAVTAPLGEVIRGDLDPVAGRLPHGGGEVASRTFTFPYRDGATFIQAVHRAGGWAAVDRLLAGDPVRSTEQILHPEKYTDTPDLPQELQLPPDLDLTGSGWAPYHLDRLGEFGIRGLLERYLDRREALPAAIGWDGDLLQVYQGPGRALAYVWLTTWDRDEDAREFFEAVQQVVPLRLAGATPREHLPGGAGTQIAAWSTASGPTWCDRHGRDVVLIEGFPPAVTDQLVARTRVVPRTPGQGSPGASDAATTASAQRQALTRLDARPSAEPAEVSGDTLRDGRFGFSIRRPPGRRWHFIESQPASTRRARLQRLHPRDQDRLLPHRFLNVDVLPQPLPLDLAQIAHQTERQLAYTLGSFRLISSSRVELDGQPAVELSYRGTLAQQALRFHLVTFLRNEHQYLITAGSPVDVYDEDHGDFMATLASIRLD
jgi:hypothetical protein